jgi:hypothetical protein
MNAKNSAETGDLDLPCAENTSPASPLLGRKSVLMGMAASVGVVIAGAAQSAAAAGTVKPSAIAVTQSAYAPKWTPLTSFALGQQVISPTNDVVSANVAHTSSGSYSADTAKWTCSPTYLSYAAAPCGGDDAPLLQAAMNAFPAGGTLILRRGTYLLRSQLAVPNKVTIRGQGRSASTLAADPAYFPVSTPVVRLGNGAVGLAFAARLEHLTVECSSIAGSTGIYSNEIQEMCGPSFCIVDGFTLYGIHYEGNCANYEIDNCEIYPTSAGATYGIFLDNSLGSNVVRRNTVGVNGHLDVGLYVKNGCATILSLHIENCTDGALYDGSYGAIIGMTGPTALSNVTNLVRMLANSRYVSVMAIVRNGATNAIKDEFFGKTISDPMVQSCILGDGYMARLDHYGDKAGFFGTPAIGKPTGVPATTAGIFAALVSLGLIGA